MTPTPTRRRDTAHPPRRPRNGHSPDCPYWHDRPAHTCGICRSETISEREKPGHFMTADGTPTGEPAGQLGSCRRCYAPTTHPDQHCEAP